VLVYASREDDPTPEPPVMLFVRRAPVEDGAVHVLAAADGSELGAAAESGLHQLSWQADALRYTLVGRHSHEDLRRFMR
jgi:hypothetical protein